MKRKVKRECPVVRKQKKLVVKRKSVKKSKKPRKQTVYHSNEKFTGGFQEEEQFNSDDEIPYCTQEELNQLAMPPYWSGNSNRAIGLRIH